jgi:twitching motility protein PilU
MVNTPYISKLIREGNFHEINEIMSKGNDSEMKTFDQSLLELYKSGKIDLETALANADSSSELEWKINFGGGIKNVEGEEKGEPLEFPSNSADANK